MSAATRTALAFTAVTTVGGLLPADMLLRIAEARNLPGTKPADYGLPASVPVRDEAERAWEYLKPLWRDLRTALPSDPVTGAPAADPIGRAGLRLARPALPQAGLRCADGGRRGGHPCRLGR